MFEYITVRRQLGYFRCIQVHVNGYWLFKFTDYKYSSEFVNKLLETAAIISILPQHPNNSAQFFTIYARHAPEIYKIK